MNFDTLQERSFQVLGLGVFCLDLIAFIEKFPQPDDKVKPNKQKKKKNFIAFQKVD